MSVGELYAQALLENTPDDTEAQQLVEELDALLAVVESVPEARHLLVGWGMSSDEREAMVDRIFSGRVSPKVESLIGVMNRRNRLSSLKAVILSMRKLLIKRQGKIEITLTTALPLDESQMQAVQQELVDALDQKAILRVAVDSDLLGGAMLRIGDRIYDGSIRAQLAKVRERLVAMRSKAKAE